MTIDFGKLNEELDNTEPTVIRKIIIGYKDIPKSGPLNFSNQETIINSTSTDVTDRPLPIRNTIDDEPFIQAQKESNQFQSKTQTNTGPLGFDRNRLPSDIVSDIELAPSLGVNVDGITGPAADATLGINRLLDQSPLAGIAPSYGLDPIIPGKTTTQILNEVAERCASRLLDELDNIDPSLRLEQLLNKAQELCSAAQFTQLREVIDKIQETKREIVQDAISRITDPIERLTKLTDMMVDAINTGAQDLVEEIASLLEFEQFNNILNALDQIDPRRAIDLLNSEIKRLTDLKQFDKIRQLLNAVNIVQNQFAEIETFVDNVFEDINLLLGEPERLVDAIQNKINEALDLNNYLEVQQILDAYDGIRDTIDNVLQELDPQRAFRKLVTLANQALADLDLGRYNRLLDEIANRLCDQPFGLLPELPNVPDVGAEVLPDFVR